MPAISHRRLWKLCHKARSPSSTAQPTNRPFTRTPSVEIGACALFRCGRDAENCRRFQCRIDGFYKSSHSILDEGQFGQALILSSFNYKRGEFTEANSPPAMITARFSAYRKCRPGNGRVARTSAPLNFFSIRMNSPFIKKHWVFLDHDQRLTSSAGISYTWKDWRATIDGLYGDGFVEVSPTLKRAIPTRHSTSACHAGFKITEKTTSRSVSMS